MPTETFRCAESAQARNEPLYGTASFVRRWLLLEQPGSWGRDALTQSKLPERVASELRLRCKTHGIRVVLIRRGVRISSEQRQCYFVRTDGGAPHKAHVFLDDVHDLLDIDLDPLAQDGAIAEADESPEPTFLVCTHGRHDACCSIRGNQVSRVACAEPGRDAWESSHIGGDRFAANVVCFPHGIYYGRVDSSEVTRLMSDYAKGTIDLDHLRGRCTYPFAVQAAEFFVRRHTGMTGVDDLRLETVSRAEERVEAMFDLSDGRRAEAGVAIEREGHYRLTCGSLRPESVPRYDLVSLSIV